MSINGLGGLGNQALRAAVTSPPDSRVGQAAKAATVTTAATDQGPAAIHHGLEGATYSNLKMFSWDTRFDENLQMQIESMELWIRGVPRASVALAMAYDSAKTALSPELMEKDWGFSVSNGALVILEGHDALTDDESATLKKALAGVTDAANGLADVTTRMFELNRGTDGKSNGIGRFDVSKDNFSSIVDLREYLDAHGPDGKYNQATSPADLQSVFGFGSYALMDQIELRAAARFSIPKFGY
jgi:hypothetical protein